MSALPLWHPAGALCGAAGVDHVLGLAPPLRKGAYVLSEDGQRVLVLDKLGPLAPADSATLAAVIDQAWVSPLEAVAQWSVVPYPYELVLAPCSAGWMIRHKPFAPSCQAAIRRPQRPRRRWRACCPVKPCPARAISVLSHC